MRERTVGIGKTRNGGDVDMAIDGVVVTAIGPKTLDIELFAVIAPVETNIEAVIGCIVIVGEVDIAIGGGLD